ncbi:uncharacterized protein LOC120347792 isoform X2 [Styela clava]
MATGGYDVATSSDEDTDMDLLEAAKQKLRVLGAYDEVEAESKELQTTSKSGEDTDIDLGEPKQKLGALGASGKIEKDSNVWHSEKWQSTSKSGTYKKLQEDKITSVSKQRALEAYTEVGKDLEQLQLTSKSGKPFFKATPAMKEHIARRLIRKHGIGQQEAQAAVQQSGCDIEKCLSWTEKNKYNFSLIEEKSKEYEYSCGKLSKSKMMEWIVDRLINTFKNVGLERAKAAVQKKGCSNYRACQQEVRSIQQSESIELADEYDNAVEELKVKEASEASATTKSGGTTTVEELQNKYGFEPNLAQLAVKLIGSGNVENCVDWAIENQNDLQLWSTKYEEIKQVSELYMKLGFFFHIQKVKASIEAVVYIKTRPNVLLSEFYKECTEWIEKDNQPDVIDILHDTFILRIGQMLKTLASMELMSQPVSPDLATAAVEATSSTNISDCKEWIEGNREDQTIIGQMSEASKAATANFRKMEMVKQLVMNQGISPIAAKAAVQRETNEENCLDWLKNNETDDGLVQMLSKLLEIETSATLQKANHMISTSEFTFTERQKVFHRRRISKQRILSEIKQVSKLCMKLGRFFHIQKVKASIEAVVYDKTRPNVLLSEFYEECTEWIEKDNQPDVIDILHDTFILRIGQMLKTLASIELMSQPVSPDLATAAVEATSSTDISDCKEWIEGNREDQTIIEQMSEASEAATANFRKMEMVKKLVMNQGISPIAAKAAVQRETNEENCLDWLKNNGTDDGLVQMLSKKLDNETSAIFRKADRVISTSEFMFMPDPRTTFFHGLGVSEHPLTGFPPTKSDFTRSGITPEKIAKEKEPNVQEGESIVNEETLHMPELDIVITGALAKTDESTIPVTHVKATTTDTNAPADKGNEKFDMKALLEKINEEVFIQSHVNASNIVKIDKMGGKIELFGCDITIPEGALEKETKFQIFLSNNPESFPKDVMPISPILGCRPSIQFNKPVKASMRTWYSTLENQEIPAMIFSREDESTDWKIMQHMTLRDRNIVEFEVNHFSDDVVAIAEDNAGDGKYHLLNDVYIQKDTATIVSVFLCDVKTQNEVSQILAKKNFVQLIPIGKKFTAKVGSEIEINLNCEEPQGTEVVCYDDTSFRVTREILDNLRHEIYFKMRPRPQQAGIIDIEYSLKIDNDEKVLPLTTTWPILHVQIPEAKSTNVYNIAANVISAGNATTNISNQSSVQIAKTSTPDDSSQESSLMCLE